MITNRLRGTVLTVAHLPSGCLAYAALVTQPQGAWDESTLTGIETACALLIVLSAVTFLLALPPVRRRTLSRWWLAPALAFLLVGAARWTYIVQTYPQGPGG